ncbi:DUF6792 domain-containing protein [Latilactobacillus sakei]|uniref:DUF6792 domain-containing protein n=1 Tax=Latilactobacillus sakei TaxID=1599 RepID=UPI0025B29349|nr:DUF6792 domain-containing protein [Latilactobacillus sakei]MDN4009721.1 hypothetical protein [Latilactobacillus sakei]
METEQMIIYLTRLETVLDDLGKLLFKAHLKVPLTLDREQSQELLRQNNRFEFRYQQLRNQKTKLLKQLLKLTSGDIYLRQKIGQLNELNQQSQAALVAAPEYNRQRKINRLRQLILNLQGEKIETSIVLCDQVLAYLYETEKTAFIAHYRPNVAPVAVPFLSRDFKMAMMMLNYMDIMFTPVELQRHIRLLVYRYTQESVDNVLIYDARTILPNAEKTGFSAVAYYFTFKQQSMTFISYKGTEGTMDDPRIKSFRQRLDNYVRESYQDWKYNIDAMLIGHTDNDEQLQLARRFTRYVVRHVKKIEATTRIYGLGHSLGGHFVQTLQLLDQPFNAGYTLNAAPVQLKQIKHYRPDLCDDATWQVLFELTKQNTQDKKIEQLLQVKTGLHYAEINNEWFIKDLMRIYFGFPYTFYIGTANYLNARNWTYPFVADIREYLKDDEMQAYSQFWGNLIHYLKRVENRNGTIILASLVTYGLQALREVYGAIKTPEAKRLFSAYARYLSDAKIFKDTPVAVQENFQRELSRPQTALRVLQGEWPFLSSVNNEMVETVIYFHTIEGARYFKSV